MASEGGVIAAHFRVNDKYKNEEFKKYIRDCLQGDHEDSKPFPHFVLTDFLSDPVLLAADLRRELQSAAWIKKCNDLYSVHQTVDLADFQAEHYPILSNFRNFMCNEVRQWLMLISGVELGDKIALTGSRYGSGDFLLPHDDKLEGRAFAFVLYLTPNWAESDGGELCLFNSDPAKNHPTEIAKRISPQQNLFSLFRVQFNSWHSVAEVICKDKSRLSLNGWFHYPEGKILQQTIGPSPAAEEPLPREKPSMNITLAEINSWLNPSYVRPGQHKHIKRIFAYKSELSLQQFLNTERYDAALAELETAKFECVGPPNKRRVWRLVESALAEDSVVLSLLQLFRSEAITLLLTQWTGLHLYDLKKVPQEGQEETTKKEQSQQKAGTSEERREEEEPPEKRSRVEKRPGSAQAKAKLTSGNRKEVEIVSFIHRFDRGCYSMADDQLAADAKSNGFCLDLLLFFGQKTEWPAQYGGFTSFFAIGETDEIMRVVPSMNTAAIVFREPEVLNFTKYVNHRAADDHFFVLSCSFFGISSGESESESESSLGTDEEESEVGGEFEGDEEEEEEEGEGEPEPAKQSGTGMKPHK